MPLCVCREVMCVVASLYSSAGLSVRGQLSSLCRVFPDVDGSPMRDAGAVRAEWLEKQRTTFFLALLTRCGGSAWMSPHIKHISATFPGALGELSIKRK